MKVHRSHWVNALGFVLFSIGAAGIAGLLHALMAGVDHYPWAIVAAVTGFVGNTVHERLASKTS